MAYVTAEAQQQLLDTVAEATDEIGVALAALGDAYERLDDDSADTLEEKLFRPVQAAYGRAKRTHAEFAGRHRLSTRAFKPVAPSGGPGDVNGILDAALDAAAEADDMLAELQDSMMPVEVGDRELRAGLAEVRRLLGGLDGAAREFTRGLGR